MLTEKQIEDVIEELEEINGILAGRQMLLTSEVREIRSRANDALRLLKTEEPQSRDCW